MPSLRQMPSPDCAVCLGVLLICVSLVSPAAMAEEKVIVLRGATLIDGTGANPRENVDITIQGEQIVSVAPMSSTAPEGAQVIRYEGKTIMPGMISAHSHVGQVNGLSRGPENYTRANIERDLRQYETYGVTTVVALGMNLPLFYELRPLAHSGELPGADLFGADRGIGVVGGAPGRVVLGNADQIDRPQTPEEARQTVREAHARGTDFIKMWVDDSRGTVPKMSHAVYAAAIDEAHQLGLRVMAHIFSLSDAKSLVDAGVDVIAHGVRDQPVDAAFIQAMKEKGVWYIPTISLNEAFYVYADRPDWFGNPFFRRSLSPELQQQIDDDEWRAKTLADGSLVAAREAVAMNQRNLAILHDAGVKIGFGSDSGAMPLRIPGFMEHRELFLLAQAGLPLLDVITIATGDTAALLHLPDRGTVEAGKLADLVVLDADPSEDIRNTWQIRDVWHRGRQVGGPTAGDNP